MGSVLLNTDSQVGNPSDGRAAPRSREPYLVLLLTFLTFLTLLPRGGHYDVRHWAMWAVHFQRLPFAEIYGVGPDAVNYPPGWLYVLALFSKIFSTPEAIDRNVHLLKVVPLVFDFLTVALAMRFLAQHGVPPQRAYFILFNFAFLYNTLHWGQLDAIHTFFVLASLLAVLERKPVWSVLCLVLAANVKLQTITFIPFLAFLNLREFLRTPWKLPVAVASAAALQATIVLPFVLAGTLPKLWTVLVVGSVDLMPLATLSAFNIWHLFLAAPNLSDRIVWMGLTLKTWGAVMYVINVGAVGLMLVMCLKRARQESRNALPYVFLCFGLAGLAFFFFPTQMHERYLCPALIFFGIYAVWRTDPWAYVLVSLGSFLNMEAILRAFGLFDRLRVPLDPRVVAVIVLAGYAVGLFQLISFCRGRTIARPAVS